MNTTTMLQGGSILMICGLAATLWIGPAHSAASGIQCAPYLVAQRDEDTCRPWQYKDRDGNCVDRPGTVHHPGNYAPRPGEQCWIECLCYEGEYPTGNSCSPCSFVGMVCTR